MGFWKRQKKDGKPTFGYGIYLTCGILAVLGALYASTKVAPPKVRKTNQNQGGAIINIGATQQASINTQEINTDDIPTDGAGTSVKGLDDDTPLGNSAEERRGSTGQLPVDINSPSEGESYAGGLESINVALRMADKVEKPLIDEGGGFFDAPETGRYQALPQTVYFNDNEGQRSGGRSMIVYDKGKLEETSRKAQQQIKSIKSTRYFLPRGEWIPCYTLTSIDSINYADTFIELGVAADVYFNHRVQIPFGTRIIASASGSTQRRRFSISANALRYPSGLEIPMSGAVRAEDKSPGVPGYYIAPPNWAQVAPFISSFMTAWLQAAEQQSSTSNGLGILQSLAGVASPEAADAISSATNQNAYNPSRNAQVAAVSAVRSLLEDRVKDLQQQYGSHLIIPAGTMVWVQTTGRVNLASAHNTEDVMPQDEDAIPVSQPSSKIESERTAASNISEMPVQPSTYGNDEYANDSALSSLDALVRQARASEGGDNEQANTSRSVINQEDYDQPGYNEEPDQTITPQQTNPASDGFFP